MKTPAAAPEPPAPTRAELAALRRAAKQGDAHARYDLGWAYYNLGWSYLDGTAGRRSLTSAKRWLTLAAQQGHRAARKKLAQWDRTEINNALR